MKKLIIILTLFMQPYIVSRYVSLEVYKPAPLIELAIKSFAQKATDKYDEGENKTDKQRFEAMNKYIQSLNFPEEVTFYLYRSIMLDEKREDIILQHLFDLYSENPQNAMDSFLKFPLELKEEIADLLIRDILEYLPEQELTESEETKKRREGAFNFLKFFIEKTDYVNHNFYHWLLEGLNYYESQLRFFSVSLSPAVQAIPEDESVKILRIYETKLRIINSYLDPLINLIRTKYIDYIEDFKTSYIEPDEELQEISIKFLDLFDKYQKEEALDTKNSLKEGLQKLIKPLSSSDLEAIIRYLINKKLVDSDLVISLFQFFYPTKEEVFEHSLSLLTKLLNDNPSLANIIYDQELARFHLKTQALRVMYRNILDFEQSELTHLLVDIKNKSQIRKKLIDYYDEFGLLFIDNFLTSLIEFIDKAGELDYQEERKALINLREILIEFIEIKNLPKEEFESEFEEIDENLIKVIGYDLMILLRDNNEEEFLKRINGYYSDYNLKYVRNIITSLGRLLYQDSLNSENKESVRDDLIDLKTILNKFLKTNNLPEVEFNKEFNELDKHKAKIEADIAKLNEPEEEYENLEIGSDSDDSKSKEKE